MQASDAVIAVALHGGRAEALSAGDVEAVGRGLDGDAHEAEILSDGFDAVSFLDAEFGGIADDGHPFGEASHHRQQREANSAERSRDIDQPPAYQNHVAPNDTTTAT